MELSLVFTQSPTTQVDICNLRAFLRIRTDLAKGKARVRLNGCFRPIISEQMHDKSLSQSLTQWCFRGETRTWEILAARPIKTEHFVVEKSLSRKSAIITD